MGKKVTVVGAGFYGSTTALRLAEYNIFDEVVLTDILEGKPEGLALDMNQSRSIEGFETKIIGATTTAEGGGYEKTANSDVVVITAGLATQTRYEPHGSHRSKCRNRSWRRRKYCKAFTKRRHHRGFKPT
jgi:malate/lactate dehydrogenase